LNHRDIGHAPVARVDLSYLILNRYRYLNNNNNDNHSSLLSLWNLEIMKDTLRLLSFHLRMLPYAVTIAYPFGRNVGKYADSIGMCEEEANRV
jgi:hypothetical protein